MDDDKVSLSVRKGAWTEQEDDLLRKCIEKHGEGKWQLVPLKAGLNRYRKSCRLRWLNYLKPTIKRGEFADDEADLIIRLHKLLGNRWSLIAGRLPGRTANDVKNYWNSLSRKKMAAQEHPYGKQYDQKKQKVNVFKPRPWFFTKNLSRPPVGNTDLSKAQSPPPPPPEEEMFCWESLLHGNEEAQGQSINAGGFSESFHWEEKGISSASGATSAEVPTPTPLILEDGLSNWIDFVIDMEIWEWDFNI